MHDVVDADSQLGAVSAGVLDFRLRVLASDFRGALVADALRVFRHPIGSDGIYHPFKIDDWLVNGLQEFETGPEAPSLAALAELDVRDSRGLVTGASRLDAHDVTATLIIRDPVWRYPPRSADSQDRANSGVPRCYRFATTASILAFEAIPEGG